MNILEIRPGVRDPHLAKAAARVREWDMESADDLYDALFFLDFSCQHVGVPMNAVIRPLDIPTSRERGDHPVSAQVWGIDRDGYAVYGDLAQHVAHISQLPI